MKDRTLLKARLQDLKPKVEELQKILRPIDVETISDAYAIDEKITQYPVDYLTGVLDVHLAFYMGMLTQAFSGMPYNERLLEMAVAGIVSSFQKLEIELTREQLENI